jgi:hypothetical protein
VATLSLTWLVVALVFIYRVSHQRLHRWTAVPFALMVVCFGGFIVSGTIGLALGPEAGASALAASSALLGWGLTLLPATTMLAGISAMIHLSRTSGSNPL